MKLLLHSPQLFPAAGVPKRDKAWAWVSPTVPKQCHGNGVQIGVVRLCGSSCSLAGLFLMICLIHVWLCLLYRPCRSFNNGCVFVVLCTVLVICPKCSQKPWCVAQRQRWATRLHVARARAAWSRRDLGICHSRSNTLQYHGR